MFHFLMKNKDVKDNLVFLTVALIAFSTEPAIVQAQGNPYNPINFTQALSLSRGSLSPSSQEGMILDHDSSCTFVKSEYGWNSEACKGIENIVFLHSPGVDTIVVETPNSDGHVRFDDWQGESLNKAIQEIWDNFAIGAKNQSQNLGFNVTPKNWRVYPTLDKSNNYMYYAIHLDWDGRDTINIKASLFDRQGYVAFRIVPDRSDYSEAQLRKIVENVVFSYSAKQSSSYVDFKDGDKIAAGGAIGVLATLVGVKYGKAIATGLFVVILAFAKKLWFLIFIPFVIVWKLLFRRNSSN
jgi:uncharacterized membrane-anchored protein